MSPSSPGISSSIVYEDHRFLVIDKPANLLVHPTGPGRPDTLWDELKRFLAFEIVNGAQISFVNRLDRETSGLILVAKSIDAARQLCLMTARHRICKSYTAIVFGWPVTERFVIDQPLLRQGLVRQSKIWLKQAVHPDGSPAFTSFHVLARFTRREQSFAVIEAEPKTGRTHQIRVHLSYAGHPIVGDKSTARTKIVTWNLSNSIGPLRWKPSSFFPARPFTLPPFRSNSKEPVTLSPPRCPSICKISSPEQVL